MTQHYLVERIPPSAMKSEAGFEHGCMMCIVWTVLDDTPLTPSPKNCEDPDRAFPTDILVQTATTVIKTRTFCLPKQCFL